MEFFYCPSSDQYKIMVFFLDPPDSPSMIYTLGSNNSWRSISEHIRFPRSRSASFNGALNWVCSDDSRSKKCEGICAFDIENEAVRFLILAPPQIRGIREARGLNVTLCRGSLSLFLERRKAWDGLDVWIMKEYAVVSSWTKLHAVLS
ncbi:hypothetical protein Tsubulata_047912 [Turnera subulata]|uniref:F-box associated beta-propeller type 1 domain-containing protein n=1 Tax=Turnera subulata TaxID=218843 RepID=A0A9Q0FF22_9ROSI|nr:hypothetical protein Tsubulata_047912 [Turnera subulata]